MAMVFAKGIRLLSVPLVRDGPQLGQRVVAVVVLAPVDQHFERDVAPHVPLPPQVLLRLQVHDCDDATTAYSQAPLTCSAGSRTAVSPLQGCACMSPSDGSYSLKKAAKTNVLRSP